MARSRYAPVYLVVEAIPKTEGAPIRHFGITLSHRATPQDYEDVARRMLAGLRGSRNARSGVGDYGPDDYDFEIAETPGME